MKQWLGNFSIPNSESERKEKEKEYLAGFYHLSQSNDTKSNE